MRWFSLAVFIVVPIAVIVIFALANLLWVAAVSAAAWLASSVTARSALTGERTDWRMPEYPAQPRASHAYLIIRTRSPAEGRWRSSTCPERLPARDQNVNLGRVAKYALGQSRDGLDEVLAAIEHQQHALLAQMRQDNRQRLVRNRHETQLGGKQTREQPRIFDGREIKEVNGPLKFGKQSVRQCQGDGGFAYPACPDDRYEALLFQQGGELTNRSVASHHEQGLPRQLRRSRACLSWRRLSLRPGNLSRKAVALAGNICNVADRGVPIAESLAKGGNVNAQTDLIDDQLPPDTPHEVTIADHFRRVLEQRDQDVEGTAANLECSAVLLEEPLGRMQAKRTKRGDFPPQSGRADRGGIVLFLGTGRAGDRGNARSSALFTLTLSTWVARIDTSRH